MNLNQRYKLFSKSKLLTRKLWLVAISLSAILSACINDEIYIKNGSVDGETPIRISAFVTPTELTRDVYLNSEEPEQVSSGRWYFTYPTQTDTVFDDTPYGTAIVDFSTSVEDPTVGFAKYKNSNGEEKDLKWKHIWDNGSSSSRYYYFYLHNIDTVNFTYTYNEKQRKRSYQKIDFKETSPFREIRPLDKENGTNDIITGVCSFWSSSKDKDFVFSLQHRLSLFRLNIEVYGALSDNHVIDLSNATVTISNLYSGLESFSISSPTNFAASTTSSNVNYTGRYLARKDFKIKGDKDAGEYQWDGFPEVDDNYQYEEETYKKVTYKSLEFVVPPQPISPSYIPKIIVKVPKADVTGATNDEGFVEYTGLLPSSMFKVQDPNTGKLDPSPLELAFNGGYELTVTATINSPETELYFSPVKVESWVSKGSFTVNTNQAGIYNLDDFKNMVKAYKECNKADLEKYGYITSNGTFIIQFWNNLELPVYLDDDTQLKGCMALKQEVINFAFLFNGCLIKLLNPDGETIAKELESSQGQIELYNIVTGQNENYTGIRSAEDFMSIVEICSEELTPDIKDLLKYGYVNNSDNTFILEVSQTFNIPIEQFFQKIPTSFGGYDVSFQFSNDAAVNLVFSSETETKTLQINTNNQNRYLDKLMFISSSYGMYEIDDFFMLTEFYNEYCPFYPDILKVFGTYNEGNLTWTFYFRNNMTIQGEKFFYSMIPDSENGNPQFTFSGSYKNGNSTYYYTLTIEDEFTPCSFSCSNAQYYVSMVQGSGKARSYSTYLGTIADNYNTNNYYNLWYYGHFDRATKKWIFPLYYETSNALYTTWSTIYGKIVPEEIAGKYDYEFDFTGVTKEYEIRSAPKSATDSSTGTTIKLTPDETGAEALKQICLGTYWEWLEQQTNEDLID